MLTHPQWHKTMANRFGLGQERGMALARCTIENLYCEALVLADEVSALRERPANSGPPVDFALHCSAIRAGAQVMVALDWLLAAREADDLHLRPPLPDFGQFSGADSTPDRALDMRDGQTVLDAVDSFTQRLERLSQAVDRRPVHTLQARLVHGLARECRLEAYYDEACYDTGTKAY